MVHGIMLCNLMLIISHLTDHLVDLVDQAWVLAFWLAWQASAATGIYYERLMRAHAQAVRRWLRRYHVLQTHTASATPQLIAA